MKKEYDLPNKFYENAISLSEFEISGFAWKWEYVNILLNYLNSNNYAILGGDVYKLENDQIDIAYDSWFCNKKDNMSWEFYVDESNKRAMEYINNYYERNGNDYCYSLVISKN